MQPVARFNPLFHALVTLALAWEAEHAGLSVAADDTDPSFVLKAGPSDFDHYFPTYLSNGYFSTMTSLRGTEGNFAYMVALMDCTKGDMARPATIPGM